MNIQDEDFLEDDDFLVIEDDEIETEVRETKNPYKILIVDDEKEVHLITRHALDDTLFLGESLEFFSAYSGEEAKTFLDDNNDIALIFLDVVMETEDAGLRLIEYIRKYLNNWLVRIVLRTGQPGQAPEREVIIDYDINDYKAKTELTLTHLFTSTLVSLRTYKQLRSLEFNRRGLEKILASSASLFEYLSMKEFVNGVVLQISSFIDFTHGILLCAMAEKGKDIDDIDDIQIVAGTKELEFAIGSSIKNVVSVEACELIQKALRTEQNIYEGCENVIAFRTKSQAASVVYFTGIEPLNRIDKQLLEVFCSKIAIGFDNINYYQQLQYKSKHDLLTGLFNRTSFIEKIDQIHLDNQNLDKLTHSSVSIEKILHPVLLVLGIDRFKDINADLGYQAGDIFLQLIAQRLQVFAPSDSIIARLGADEFAVYIPQIQDISKSIEQIRINLNQPIEVSHQELIPSVSIGYTIITQIHKPCYDLLATTETALLSAKQIGGNRCVKAHNTTIKPVQQSRLTLTRELTYALSRQEFAMYYQPILHAKSGRLAGFEALLRWNHPERGVVSPGAFIDLIESTDLILPIGDWVLRDSIQQTHNWNKDLNYQFDKEMFLSINISTRQLTLSNLVEQINNFLKTHDVVPSRLKLEITESLIIEDIDKAEVILKTLKELGVKLSLDDFGTGYSSVNYLHRLPFDTLKLDKSFIQDVRYDVISNPLIRYAINLAHDLNMDVIAEGVETAQQHQDLVWLGCDYVQGFLFARPMPVSQATDFIINHDAGQYSV